MSVITPAIRAALLAQISCGNIDLKTFLEGEIDFLWDCQDNGCFPQLQYIYTQLGLIEAAQIFSRNQIDTYTGIAQSQMRETYTARSQRRMDSERDSNAKSCSWATATSAQYFNRDSTDWNVGYSEGISHRTAERLENGYDKSCRHTTGHGFHFSKVVTVTDDLSGEAVGPGSGTDEMFATRSSNRSSGTGPYIPLMGTDWTPLAPIASPPWFAVDTPGPLFPLSVPSSSEQFCPSPTPQDPDPECQLGSYPSLGQGYHGKWRVSVGLPVVGVLTIEYDQGRNERQYFTCSGATTTGLEDRTSLLQSGHISTVNANPSDNHTQSREKSDVYHLVRKYGSSTRRGNEQVDAEDTGKGRANGLAHSESERTNQSNGHSQSRAESFATSHSESHLRRTENASADDVAKKYGQISQHLGEMWNRVWQRLMELERMYAAVPYGASMNCNKVKNPCPCPSRVPFRIQM